MTQKAPRHIRINQIIDAAVHEFIEKGFHDTSMQSIAAKAGISKGGLYHHFNSKDEILIEANNRCMTPIFKLMATARQCNSPTKGMENFIYQYVDFWARHSKELVFTFLSIAKILVTKEMWPDIEDYAKYMTLFYEELLRKGIQHGELLDHDYKSRSVAIFSSLDGIIGYIVMCKHLAPQETAASLIEVYLKDIAV